MVLRYLCSSFKHGKHIKLPILIRPGSDRSYASFAAVQSDIQFFRRALRRFHAKPVDGFACLYQLADIETVFPLSIRQVIVYPGKGYRRNARKGTEFFQIYSFIFGRITEPKAFIKLIKALVHAAALFVPGPQIMQFSAMPVSYTLTQSDKKRPYAPRAVFLAYLKTPVRPVKRIPGKSQVRIHNTRIRYKKMMAPYLTPVLSHRQHISIVFPGRLFHYGPFLDPPAPERYPEFLA
ncbi:MAG: hypothetical protein ABIG11_05005, partial [bacterium]